MDNPSTVNSAILPRSTPSAAREAGSTDSPKPAAHELDIRIAWQSTSNQAIIHGVKEGLGISILPYFLVQESLDRGETAEFKIKGLTLNRKFSVIYHRNKFLPKSAMALMDLCKGNA